MRIERRGRPEVYTTMGTKRVILGALAALVFVLGSVAGAGADEGWPHRVGDSLVDTARAVATDASGNVYAAGEFRGTVCFGYEGADGCAGFELTSRGDADIFAGKLDPAGRWLWVKQAGGSDYDTARALAVDAAGNIYVGGHYRSADARFGPRTLPHNHVEDAFVFKLDASGYWDWSACATGVAWDSVSALAVNDDGEVFVGGDFKRTISFVQSTGTIVKSFTTNTSASPDYLYDSDPFVAKLSATGAWEWAVEGSGDFTAYPSLNDVNANWCCTSPKRLIGHDANYPADGIQNHYNLICNSSPTAPSPDGLYVYQFPHSNWYLSEQQCRTFFEGQTALFPVYHDSVINNGPVPYPGVTPAPHDTAATLLYGRPEAGRESRDTVTGIAVVMDDSDPYVRRSIIYVTGSFQENLTFFSPAAAASPPAAPAGPASVGPVSSAGQNRYDVFVAKLVEEHTTSPTISQEQNPNPQWHWVIESGGAGTDEIAATGLAADSDGDIFLTGWYTGSPSLTSAPLPDTLGATHAFAAKVYDGTVSGSWVWATTAGSDSGDPARGISVAVDDRTASQRGVYVTGSFQRDLSFYDEYGLVSGSELSGAGTATDVFVTRLMAGDGSVDWTTRGGLFDADAAQAIASDPSGTTFVAGGFNTVSSFIEGSSMALNGVDEFVYGPVNVSENFGVTAGGGYGVSLWFRTTDPGAGIYSVVDRTVPNTGGGHDRHLYLNGGNLAARIYATAGSETIQTTGSNFADGLWHHVVHTFGPGVGQKLYVDGFELASGSFTHSEFDWQTGVFIGYSQDAVTFAGGTGFFEGMIADVRFFDDTVPVAQVQALAAQQPDESSGKLLFSGGGQDVFLASLTSSGAWRETEKWVVGEEVVRPAGTIDREPEYVIMLPDGSRETSLTAAGQYFFWSIPERKLYSIRPASAQLKWYVSTTPTDPSRMVSVGTSNWPDDPQIHVGNIPVELTPVSPSPYYYSAIAYTANNATDTTTATGGGRVFESDTEGYTVLRYGNGGGDITVYPVKFQVVKTVNWDNHDHLVDGEPWQIGRRLYDDSHVDPLGRNGFVYFVNAFYDGYGDDKAYDRSTRMGPIIPVNRVTQYNLNSSATSQSSGRDMVVVWYETNLLNVPWPVKPVRYDVRWPDSPPKIVIASELGSDVYGQAPLDPLVFPQAHVYRQEDSTKPGYNPNEEHAALFPSATGNGYDALFALRNDLYDAATKYPSEPYALLKYRNPAKGHWEMAVYQVLATDTAYPGFNYQGTAGTPIFPPYPVRLLNACSNSWGQGNPYWQDSVNNQYWARSAGTVTARYYYPLLLGWDYPPNPVTPGALIEDQGRCVGWLDRSGGVVGDPVAVNYTISWPADVPVLQVGETLLSAKRGLPDIINQAAAEIVYDELDANGTNPAAGLAELIDPLNPRSVPLASLPSSLATRNVSGKLMLEDLPFHLKQRVLYDPLNKKLIFQGYLDESGLGDPLLLLNVMTGTERATLLDVADITAANKAACGTNAYCQAVWDLFYRTRNPLGLDLDATPGADLIEAGSAPLIGVKDEYALDATGNVITPMVPDGVAEPLKTLGSGHALTAGSATGTGFLTLAFNNDPSLSGLPVSLQVVRVDCGPYLGEIKVIESDIVFDERLTLRHSGDFGGNPENFTFEWYYHPDEDGTSPTPLPSPETSQLNGWLPFDVPNGGLGANSITIGGASLQTLSDNWFFVRYKGYPTCLNSTVPTPWTGAPGSTEENPTAQLAEGWIKRVMKKLNAFEARVKDFHAAPTATYASMIRQAGERYEGDVAMNNDPDNLNSMGLIEAYETVLRRGIDLSIGGTPPIDYAPANAALLLAASRVTDLYSLLGNEAYGDAADPTIGFGTQGGDYGTAATSIFAFQNQLDSLLEEELTLLRGRDYTAARPIYNRLVWNFTIGDGEVAYSQVYGLTDQNDSGVIDEYDARILYPQGHGDAWGHYLTGINGYYRLLRHPYYSWDPRAEAILVAGAPVMVDYYDERKFAGAAAAKAKTGAEVVDLTYRKLYVEDPAGQWAGYKDVDPDRAWGLDGWGRRAGQGAFFDWAVANAILPAEDQLACSRVGEDPNVTAENCHDGIQKIDRTTVLELGQIADAYRAVQQQLDKADLGLNPLGLSPEAVPFDIDPDVVKNEYDSITHFEQIYKRAKAANTNAVAVFDHANQLGLSLRRNQDSLVDFTRNVNEKERDFKNRLIEIFGYPYDGDIGPGGEYPANYDGPDLFHYMWLDPNELTGLTAPVMPANTVPVTVTITEPTTDSFGEAKENDFMNDIFGELNDWPSPVETARSRTFTYKISKDGYGIVLDTDKGVRRARGELQRKLGDFYQKRAAYERTVYAYEMLIEDINSKAMDLYNLYGLHWSEMRIKMEEKDETLTFNWVLGILHTVGMALQTYSESFKEMFDDTSNCFPRVAGFSFDLTSGPVCAMRLTGTWIKIGTKTAANILYAAEYDVALAKEMVGFTKGIELEAAANLFEEKMMLSDLEALIRQEPALRLDAFMAKDLAQQAKLDFQATLAEGQRTLDDLVAFRKKTAGIVQEYRYQDMAFRIFRNDAIQKYRAQFDLASLYTYLAAKAYDYETNLPGTANGSGRDFLAGIVKERALGVWVDGEPTAGTQGLADPLARLKLNYDVLKGQLGFNNPQQETNRFSLRSELFRIADPGLTWPAPGDNPYGNDSFSLWSDALAAGLVDDLWSVPEFRQYCRPFAPEADGEQPGLVIPFATTVNYGLNFFGWPLGGGDNAYDPTNFATKVRSVGIWFSGYDATGLSNTPRVYLVPAGMDVLRSPSDDTLATREWRVVDQKLPVPFPLAAADLTDPEWIPLQDSLADVLGGARRFSSFRAYHDDGFDESEMTMESRLVGRSVWNTKWMLIIPGATLYYDPDEGLDRFLSGVSDIKLHFRTYGYSGN